MSYFRKIEVKQYSKECKKEWDVFCRNFKSISFQYSREFLEYQEDKITDKSVMTYVDNKLVAIFPIAFRKDKPLEIISHIGSSFGGMLIDKQFIGNDTFYILDATLKYLRQELQIEELIYRYYPEYFRSDIRQDDFWALLKCGAKIRDCFLTTLIDLQSDPSYKLGKFKSIKDENLVMSDDIKYITQFWEILNNNLSIRYKVKPVHTSNELINLACQFPENIKFRFALDQGKVVGGLVFFNTNTVAHLQYVASNDFGRNIGAIERLIVNEIDNYRSLGFKYFDFGHSFNGNNNENNQNLMKFKLKFGGYNFPLLTFIINLKSLNEDQVP